MRQVSGQDEATGEEIETWVTVADGIWAEKRERRTGERFVGGVNQVAADVDAVFRTRWHPFGDVIQPDTYRIVYPVAPRPERIWNITGLGEISRKEGIEMAVSARAEGPVR